jgi:protein phosphatase
MVGNLMDRPSHRLRTNSYSQSHVGRVRELNEDRSFSNAACGIWAVADGMGGHDAGDLASEAIVRNLEQVTPAADPKTLNMMFWESIRQANQAIREIAKDRGQGVVGSTIVALLIFDNAYRCLWSGDSRAYLFRNGALQQLSRDHTELQELLDRGVLEAADAENYYRKNVIVHAIGVESEPYMDFTDGVILSGDIFLLCSDGLTTHVSNDEIAGRMPGRRAKDICSELIDLALSRGGTDNVTVNVIQFYSSSTTITGMSMPQIAEIAGNPNGN